MIPKDFRDKHHQRMAEEDAVLYLPKGKQTNVPPHQQPSYQVITVQLRGKNDEPIMLSGNELTLPIQLSILKAVDILAEIRGWGKGGGEGSAMSRGGIVKRAGQPKVTLFFIEDMADVEPGYAPVKGIITFRLMNVSDDPDSEKPKITTSDIKNLANAIKTQFLTPSPYVWKKGREMVSYSEWKQGYQLQLYSRSKASGIELVKKILAIQNHPYISKRLNHKVNEDEAAAYPTVPPEINVLGKTVKAPRYRPVADVVLEQASLALHFFPQDIVLVNAAGEILPGFENL